jgi:ribosomal protein S18 acetylase RimI-like enzyme
MAVARGARRQGIGSALCAACGRVARAWGEPCVLLHVAADNAGAQRMYSALGFQPAPGYSSGLSGLVKGPWTQQRMVANAPQLARSGGRSKPTPCN